MKTKVIELWKKAKPVFRGLLVFFFIAAIIFLFVSLISEIKTNESFISNQFNLTCPVFMRASAVFEIIKVVGFSNIIVAWIYANSEKKMLGLSYLDILNNSFKYHGVLSVIHFITTLICIAVSSSGLSESAIISLAIVLFGLFYQFYVFYCIYLNSNKCADLADKAWHKTNKHFDTVQDKVLCLASTIPNNGSKQYRAHIKCFSSLFVEFIVSKNNKICLKEIFQVWDKLLSDNSKTNVTLIEDIFGELFIQILNNKTCCKSKCYSSLLNGYISCRIFRMRQENNFDEYRFMIKEIETLTETLHKQCKQNSGENLLLYANNCVQTNIYLISWILFQKEDMRLTKEILNTKPNEVCDEFFDEMVDIIFSKSKEKNLDNEKCVARAQLI